MIAFGILAIIAIPLAILELLPKKEEEAYSLPDNSVPNSWKPGMLQKIPSAPFSDDNTKVTHTVAQDGGQYTVATSTDNNGRELFLKTRKLNKGWKTPDESYFEYGPWRSKTDPQWETKYTPFNLSVKSTCTDSVKVDPECVGSCAEIDNVYVCKWGEWVKLTLPKAFTLDYFLLQPMITDGSFDFDRLPKSFSLYGLRNTSWQKIAVTQNEFLDEKYHVDNKETSYTALLLVVEKIHDMTPNSTQYDFTKLTQARIGSWELFGKQVV